MRLADLPREPAGIVIFGASGDLTRRKLIPALHSLSCEGLLHPRTRIVGVARSELSHKALCDRLYEGVRAYARLKPGMCELWPEFAKRISYVAGAYDDPDTYRRLTQRLAQLDEEGESVSNLLFYLAILPFLYPVVVKQLGRSRLLLRRDGWSRIIIEKPFGRDLKSARELNRQVHEVFDECQVYRIDHYLGKETVQNIMVFRFANSIFEPVWNRNYVDHVQITVAESIGVEHRGGYYDSSGVLRDMFQNHLLQLLTLVAHEPPSSLDAKVLRDEKAKVLQAIAPIPLSDALLGQYQGYRDEPATTTDSRTPTYVALKLHVNNWRWQGVPFYVRTGKRLATKSTEITLHFRRVPHLLFPQGVEIFSNRISLYIQPNEGIHLYFQTKLPGAGMRVEPVDMVFRYGERFGETALPDAYERLLLDALLGDASLFSRSDAVELAWELVDPLTVPIEPRIYLSGNQGPEEADALIARDGRRWLPIAPGSGREPAKAEG